MNKARELLEALFEIMGIRMRQHRDVKHYGPPSDRLFSESHGAETALAEFLPLVKGVLKEMPEKKSVTKFTAEVVRSTKETVTVNVEAESKEDALVKLDSLIKKGKVNFSNKTTDTTTEIVPLSLKRARTWCCTKMEEALTDKKNKNVFFDFGNLCGVDPTVGQEQCMDSHGLFFDFCPFCGTNLNEVLGG
jgi:hypothetical protein